MKNIFIVRHGQSEANANVRGLLSKEGSYVIDSAFDITPLGKEQAINTAMRIRKLMLEQYKTAETEFTLFVSPYKRTRSTANILEEKLCGSLFAVKKKIEDPRLVEQDFGDFDFQYRSKWPEIAPHSFEINQAKYYDDTGRFFARLENGENLLDVYNRVSLFVTTRLEREMNLSPVSNYIIVTHGNTMRVMKMFLQDLPIEAFQEMEVPENAGGYYFTYDEDLKKYKYVSRI